MNWWKNLEGKVRFQELLKHYTTFKIGGPAKFFVEPTGADELKLVLNILKGYTMPLLVIGAGSNILINDNGVDGVVLRLNSVYFKRIIFKNNCLMASSGVMLSRIVRATQEYGLSGLEFLAGIPGTVGGALIMNAGLPKESIADLVKDVTVMEYDGNIKILNKKEIRFGYRTSNLSKYIILSTHLNLVKRDKQEVKNKINKYIIYRKLTQDLSKPSAGCVFKNPPGDQAGRLIELCGLKGKRIGDAYISSKHANFILNKGNALASDVLKLMDLIKKTIKNKFNITLEPEIKIWH